MNNLFTYGTLMCEEIMQEVSGSRLPRAEALLKGFRRRRVRDEEYPGIVPCKGGLVRGVVYRDIPQEAWDRLDRFEGNLYTRHAVCVWLEGSRRLQAQTYVICPEHRDVLTGYDWSFETFLRRGKARFRNSYKGYSHI